MTNKITQQGEQKQRTQNLKQDKLGSATKFMQLRGSGYEARPQSTQQVCHRLTDKGIRV